MLKRKDIFGVGSLNETSDKLNLFLSGTEITGDIVSNSNLLIEGEINGNISCSGKVQIGTTGKIKGNLVCANADVEGALDGELTIENLLILRSTARIKGDIQTLKLNIEEGAFFEGNCVMKSPVSTNNTFKADIEFD
jgi:cytoskeletal protein CcmA (bactofilin family)